MIVRAIRSQNLDFPRTAAERDLFSRQITAGLKDGVTRLEIRLNEGEQSTRFVARDYEKLLTKLDRLLVGRSRVPPAPHLRRAYAIIALIVHHLPVAQAAARAGHLHLNVCCDLSNHDQVIQLDWSPPQAASPRK